MFLKFFFFNTFLCCLFFLFILHWLESLVFVIHEHHHSLSFRKEIGSQKKNGVSERIQRTE